jgi:Swt1-like HEPN
MEPTNRDLVGRSFELLAEGLEPFVEHHLKGIVPGGMDWLEWLSRHVYKQNSGLKLSKRDPLVLLRAIAHEEKTFALSRAERSYVQELWDCRNRWAHNTVFDEADTRRVLDTAERLLRAADAVTEADAVRALLVGHQRGATMPRQARQADVAGPSPKYVLDARDAGALQVGDGNVQHNDLRRADQGRAPGDC